MVSRLTLSNRPENLKALREFLRDWGKQQGLSRSRSKSLEKAASEIFHFIIKRVYRPGVPGSLTVMLEDTGVRLRLVFEDDGPPYDAPPWPPSLLMPIRLPVPICPGSRSGVTV